MLNRTIALSAIMIQTCGSSAAADAKPVFTTFIVGDVQTIPTAINKSGDIAGTFTQSDGTVSGFIVESGGLRRKFFHPGQSLLLAFDINDNGLITGFWQDASGQQRCFVRTKKNKFRDCGPAFSTGFAINNDGIVTGTWEDAQDKQHGFIDDNGVVQQFDVDGADETSPQDINDAGLVTGHWGDSEHKIRGFVGDPSSLSFVSFAVNKAKATLPTRINAAGAVAGFYVKSDDSIGSFLRDPATGAIKTFDPAGANSSEPDGINKNGVIAGDWVDSLGLEQGYVSRAGSRPRAINVPQSSQTFPEAINDSGKITGWTESTKCNGAATCGFLHTP
jgi:uncharacterized membrane protein